MKLHCGRALGLLLLVLGSLLLNGCRTPEQTENLSERPWNTPRGWETGLPGRFNEGR